MRAVAALATDALLIRLRSGAVAPISALNFKLTAPEIEELAGKIMAATDRCEREGVAKSTLFLFCIATAVMLLAEVREVHLRRAVFGTAMHTGVELTKSCAWLVVAEPSVARLMHAPLTVQTGCLSFLEGPGISFPFAPCFPACWTRWAASHCPQRTPWPWSCSLSQRWTPGWSQ